MSPQTPSSPREQALLAAIQWWYQHPQVLLARAALVVLILAAAFVAYAVVRRGLRRLQRELTQRAEGAPPAQRRRTARSLTIVSLLASIAKWAIFLTAILWILALGGMNLLPVLTGAGIAGLAIGFGAQSLIRDFFSGLFMMLEGQFAVGDHVTINAIFGTVEELGLRVTVLRDVTGKLHYLPNGTITTVTVYEELQQGFGLRLEILRAEQADLAARTLTGVLSNLKDEFPAHLLDHGEPQVRTREGGTASLQVSLQVFPDQLWLPQEELPARLLARLKAAEIAVPEDLKPRVYPLI